MSEYHDIIGREAEKMLEYVETGTTDSAESSFEVPAAAYTGSARSTMRVCGLFRCSRFRYPRRRLAPKRWSSISMSMLRTLMLQSGSPRPLG